MGAAMLIMAGSFAVYFKYSQGQIADLNQEKAVLTVQVATVKRQYEFLEEQIKKQAQAQEELNRNLATIRKETGALAVLLSKHDLGNLAVRKPGLIENRVNKGTAEVMRKMEEISNPDSYYVKPAEEKSE